MENNKKLVDGGSSSSSSSMSTLDHLFGPKDSSSASHSSSTGLFGSIFPPPSTVLGRDKRRDYGSTHAGNNNMSGKSQSSGSKDSMYQSETGEPFYFSSSIYYGGQENYSPRTNTTDHSHQPFKKDGKDDDPNSNGASRGNWWQGSLYY